MNTLSIAKWISIIGHPLLLGSIYVVFVSFYRMERPAAILVSGLVIGLVVVPIALHNWRKVKNGKYGNFDVSDQQQRKNFYPFALVLFVVLLLLFYFLQLPSELIMTSLVFFFLLLTMGIVNLKLKASLHAAIAFFISLNLFALSIGFGLALLVFAFAISWSRLVKRSHSLQELVVGGFLGAAFGGISLWV
ncbi:hypothetical protein P872_10925 [Rhodonellum psychrophilum GCM71 = DSM 17998]|uniref:Phosphatidic acid phosphatase type 2/haloperoxidase domain-containing protein n=1 Tax=Rhodonellum psychrophilum GCM71 = DSM 17998 TaxID=1123057 RepID=U5BTV4_9BACT|nr:MULTISPECIES: hypothetical protein [Rhodonellum]ERM80954.1 hypothetical protein P872_10925 [Rhodonellum psychrophilum GCM71 = DSM 17998]